MSTHEERITRKQIDHAILQIKDLWVLDPISAIQMLCQMLPIGYDNAVEICKSRNL